MSQTWMIDKNAFFKGDCGIPWTGLNFISNKQNFTSILLKKQFLYYDNENTALTAKILDDNGLNMNSIQGWANEAYRTVSFLTPPRIPYYPGYKTMLLKLKRLVKRQCAKITKCYIWTASLLLCEVN